MTNNNNEDICHGWLQDSFCTDVPLANGACPSVCASCAESLQTLVLDGGKSAPGPGYYPKGCLDAIGYAWAPCDASALPANAMWTSSSLQAGDSRGCGWACRPQTLAWNGGCLACFRLNSGAGTSLPCVPGQVLHAVLSFCLAFAFCAYMHHGWQCTLIHMHCVSGG